MKLGIILNTNDPESAWNAFRLGNAALKQAHEVGIFLLGKGVECEIIQTETFDVPGELNSFKQNGGRLLACGTCLVSRKQKTRACNVSTMDGLLKIIAESDKVVSIG
ncbi:MAG: DsrE family protein [Candidatus Micrarchaeota archaeon]